MKRILPYITLIILVAVVFGGFGHVAHAQTTLVGCAKDMNGCVTDIMAMLVNMALTVTSWILAVSGYLLNFSMNLTLQIKAFVEGTPAIYSVWRSIRDISGIFLIGLLLWAALKMILAPLGFNAKMGELISTIVMAGILINFSFFITGLGIDVSNVVSVQLYNAIAPANDLSSANISANGIRSTLGDGGISDIFMSALKITNIYDPKTGKLTSDGMGNGTNIASASLKIILGGVIGIIIMITAALSFFVAALAFIVRFVILIFLLGFSPIIFASSAIPQLAEYAKKWKDTYVAQLTFMPTYLLLMYFAMKVLTESNLFQQGFAGNLTSSNAWYSNFLVLGINAVFVILMLNAPLLAALKAGAMAPEWAKKVDATAMWKKIGGWAGGNVGRGVTRLGWGDYKLANLDKAIGNTRIGNSMVARDLRSVTTGQITKAKFGSSRSVEDVDELKKKIDTKAKEIGRTNDLRKLVASGTATPDQYKNVLKNLKSDARIDLLGKENLKNPDIWRSLDRSDFEAIKKSDKFTPDDLASIENVRKSAFSGAITSNDRTSVKHMIKNMDVEDVAEVITANAGLAKNPGFVSQLSAENLNKIKNHLSDNEQHEIAKNILTWRVNPTDPAHPAEGWMKREAGKWITSNVTAHGKTYVPS